MQHPLALAELITYVKNELLSYSINDDQAAFLSIDSIELDVQVTATKSGKTGIAIYVVEAGGELSRADVQSVKITLSPLLSKEDRVKLYQKRHPDLWTATEVASIEGTIKGSAAADDVFSE